MAEESNPRGSPKVDIGELTAAVAQSVQSVLARRDPSSSAPELLNGWRIIIGLILEPFGGKSGPLSNRAALGKDALIAPEDVTRPVAPEPSHLREGPHALSVDKVCGSTSTEALANDCRAPPPHRC